MNNFKTKSNPNLHTKLITKLNMPKPIFNLSNDWQNNIMSGYFMMAKNCFLENLKQKERITLTFGQDLYTFKLGVKTKQTQFGAFTYNEESNKLYQAKTQHKVEGLPRLGDQIFEASEKLFNAASLEYGRIPTGDEAFLETILKKRQETAMADANYITATSGNNKLKIGSIITVNAREEKQLSPLDPLWKAGKPHFQIQEIGTYIITEITHKATDIGEYENSFKALPAFIKTLPEPQIAFPQAQNQQAIVIDNADPKGQGRIRVKMLWQQTKNLRTQWIRVMTPDAGTSGEVPTNRGMVFIPEIGDHVMLGFRYNDPNRPYSMGSLFNGTTGKGGQDKNHLKSIFTRGGSTITLNELENSILIKDPSGNIWFMDGKGNITVTAPKNITMNAGENITMNATDVLINSKNNYLINVANKMTTKVGTKILRQTANLKQVVTGSTSLYSGKILINSTDGEVKIQAKELTATGKQSVLLHSDKNLIANSKGDLHLKGESGNKQSNVATSYTPSNTEKLDAKGFTGEYDKTKELNPAEIRVLITSDTEKDDHDQPIKHLAGKLLLKPNSDQHRKRRKVRMVQVNCKPTDANDFYKSIKKEDIKTFLREKCFSHFLIKPEFKADVKVLDLTKQQSQIGPLLIANPDKSNSNLGTDDKLINEGGKLLSLLKKEYNKQLNPDYDDDNPLIIFFVNYRWLSKYEVTSYSVGVLTTPGYSDTPGKFSMILNNGINKHTISYETLHTLGLDHTFETVDDKSNSKHKFIKFMTKNIMDYAPANNTGTDLIETYKWQWDTVDAIPYNQQKLIIESEWNDHQAEYEKEQKKKNKRKRTKGKEQKEKNKRKRTKGKERSPRAKNWSKRPVIQKLF